MAEALLIQPDADFIKGVIASGGGDLKKCMQCGTCSATCALAPDDSAFPRKQMFAAQWGLKEKLVADPAIWLCHNCGDCTAQCPRGARPGDVFGALRQQAVEYYARPKYLGRMVQNPKVLWLLLLVPALIFIGIAVWAPEGEATSVREFANVYPIPVLEGLFFSISAIVVISFGVALGRFVKALKTGGGGTIGVSGLLLALKQIVTHERFAKCDENDRRLGHLLIFWGFVGLALMGTIVGIGSMVGLMRTPLEFTSPLKLFGNLSAIAALAGSFILLGNRLKSPSRNSSTYFDWLFLVTLTAVLLTGLVSELLRLTQADGFMYSIYFVHLVLVFSLFVYAPYTKLAHIAYRTAAMAAVKGSK